MGSGLVAVGGGSGADVPLERVLVGYRGYLLRERGLSDATVGCYLPRARLFLSQCGALEGLGWIG